MYDAHIRRPRLGSRVLDSTTQRFAEYRTERDFLLSDPDLPVDQQSAALESLRAEHFDELEVPRVRALDRADQVF